MRLNRARLLVVKKLLKGVVDAFRDLALNHLATLHAQHRRHRQELEETIEPQDRTLRRLKDAFSIPWRRLKDGPPKANVDALPFWTAL